MHDFLSQHLSSLLVGAIILAILLSIVIKLLRDRKRSVSSCSGCPHAGSCGIHNQQASAPGHDDIRD
jgi:hypothetical protein